MHSCCLDQMYSVLLQYVAKQKTVEEGVQDMWEVRLTTRSNRLIIVLHISLRLHHKGAYFVAVIG